MRTTYNAAYVSLHVRQTNRAALGLYKDTLGFKVIKIEKGYCASELRYLRLSSPTDRRGLHRCGRRSEHLRSFTPKPR